jgi:hypothetical protein
VLRNGSLFIGCGVADDFAYQDRNHTQLSRRPGHPLRPRPNRPNKYRFSCFDDGRTAEPAGELTAIVTGTSSGTRTRPSQP